MKIISENSNWKHPSGSNLLFAYTKESYSSNFKKKIIEAYNTALGLFKTIQRDVHKETGKSVTNGVYIIDEELMIKLLNSIPGMAQTSTNQKKFKGEGTASEITVDFFQNLLSGLGGNVNLITGYLTEELSAIQNQTRKLKENIKFGALIAIVNGIEEFNTVTISFIFITLSSKESVKSFINLKCKSTKSVKLDLNYSLTRFNYNNP